MTLSFPVSNNVGGMNASSTLKAGQTAAKLREEGVDIIDLTVGEPDFDTPAFIKDFAIEGLKKGLTKYTPSAGSRIFQESIAAFYAGQFGTTFPASQVAASCGGKQGLFNAACTILNPGDELLIPKPYWVTFPEIGTFCGAKNVFIETGESDFILTAEKVEESITDKTKLLIINSPNNPTGRVVPADELRRIVEVCARNNVFVLADECYLFFVYPPGEVFTSAALPDDLRHFVCVAGSFSKTYAMTGWRIGYTIANDDWTRAMVKLQSHSATHPTSFVQYACAQAMQNPAETLSSIKVMLAEYAKRKEMLIPALAEIKGFRCAVPEGAFYALVDVREMIGDRYKTSGDVADRMLREAHVAVTDGSGFGAEGYLRFSYATSTENLIAAIDRIKNLLDAETETAAIHL